MNIANDILDAIEIIVRQVVNNETTQIYTGVCESLVDSSSCNITINGKTNTVKFYGGVPTVNSTYRVFVPCGNMSTAFIIVPGSGGGGGSGSGDVSSVNGKTGAVILTASDVGAVKKAGDTMTGALIAQNNTNYTTPQVRNIIISTEKPSGGGSGDLWVRYSG